MDSYFDEDDNFPDSKLDGFDRLTSKGEDTVEEIIRDIITYIATANADPLTIGFTVATMVMRRSDKEGRRNIAESIFKAGIMQTMRYQEEINNYLHALQYLVPSMAISFPEYLKVLCSYKLDVQRRINDWDAIIEQIRRLTICSILRKARCSFNSDHWTDDDYKEMREVVHNVYIFLIECITRQKLSDIRDHGDQTVFEVTFLEYFSRDVFFINLLKLSLSEPNAKDFPQPEIVNRLPFEIVEAMKQFDVENREIVFKRSDRTLSYEWDHSIVDSTVNVFVSARMNVHCDAMRQDIETAAQMVGQGPMWMWKSAIRSAIQLLLDTPHDSPIRAFVETFYVVRLPRMIQGDNHFKKELLEHTARDMVSALNKLPSHIWFVFQDALEKGGFPRDMRVNVHRYTKTEPKHDLITRSPIAERAHAIAKVQTTADLTSILPSLFDSSCISLNCALAHLSVEGGIHRKTSIMADLNRSMEVPSEGVSGEKRWKWFDATFCALLHTYYTVNRLTVRRMVCGEGRGLENTKGVFYRWVSRFGRRDTTPNDNRDMDNVYDEHREERTEKARGFIQRLKSQCPLVEDDSNYSDLFDILPYLARLLLEEAGKNAADLTTALSTLSSSPSLLYCLVQWLYCLDHSEGRVSLVRSMDRFMRELTPAPDERDIWQFMIHSSSPLMKEMMKGPRTQDCLNCLQTVVAFMIRPLRYKHEIARSEMVKKGITVASRGGCLSPWVIDLIESGNHAAQYDWVKVWEREFDRVMVMDEMTDMGELLMGAAMIDPLQICRAICQQLGDKLLSETENTDGRVMAYGLFVFLCRFIAQMMMMAVWAIENGEKRLREIEKEGGEEIGVPKKKLRFEDENVEDVEDEAGMVNAHLREMRDTLLALFNRMVKACRKGCLRKNVSAVSLILKEIATGPKITATEELKKMVPPELLELLACIDPLSVPFELFCCFVQDRKKRLALLCKWKNWKGVEYEETEKKDEDMWDE